MSHDLSRLETNRQTFDILKPTFRRSVELENTGYNRKGEQAKSLTK